MQFVRQEATSIDCCCTYWSLSNFVCPAQSETFIWFTQTLCRHTIFVTIVTVLWIVTPTLWFLDIRAGDRHTQCIFLSRFAKFTHPFPAINRWMTQAERRWWRNGQMNRAPLHIESLSILLSVSIEEAKGWLNEFSCNALHSASQQQNVCVFCPPCILWLLFYLLKSPLRHHTNKTHCNTYAHYAVFILSMLKKISRWTW